MIIDREKFNNVINRYIYKKIKNNYEYKKYFKIIVASIIYIILLIFQAKEKLGVNISGIIAQILILICIYLVLVAQKKGFITVIILNLISVSGALSGFFIQRRMKILPALFLLPISFFTITIIYLFQRKLNKKIDLVNGQKEELELLYNEVLKKENLILEKNKELIKYNEVMKKNEEKLNYVSLFDILTELPNRKMLMNRIDFMIDISKKMNMEFSVVFIDLDDFKKINDFKGHEYGDLLLINIKEKLIRIINKEDMLGRFAGDEFGLIIQRELSENDILKYLEVIRKTLSQSIIINNNEFSLSASIGVAIYPRDGNNSSELLKAADTAMHNAKRNGKNNIQFFDIEMKKQIIRRIEFENKLLSGIKKGEFYIVFQPQYSASNKELKGFEALLRWESKELGMVSPAEFIPFAEENSFIIELGEFVFKEVCIFLKRIQDKYNSNYKISVNISIIQIMNNNFMEMIKSIINQTKVDPKNLEIEITESVFIGTRDYTINIINQLRELGISIALDDFGTGYSSLSYLQILPIDKLKIDKSFIDSINNNDSKKEIIELIINLMRKMNIITVAEGIENEDQLNYLKENGCDIIQGYLWGKPLKEDITEELIKSELNK